MARLARLSCVALIEARGSTSFDTARTSVEIACAALLEVPATFTVLLVELTFLAEATRLLALRAGVEAPEHAAAVARLRARIIRRFWRFSLLFPVARASYIAATQRRAWTSAPAAGRPP